MSLFNCFKKKKTRLFYPEIELNSPPANEGKDFPANRISSTKYTIITFLPKNLWEQFRRITNFYFLIIAIVSLIPSISPLSPGTTWGPLIFVLAVSAIKDAIEDIIRWRSDSEVNNREYEVLRDGKFSKLRNKEIKVGDVVCIHRDEEAPADAVILATSDDDGIAYVDTANLDGETNLKPYKARPETKNLSYRQLKRLSARVSATVNNANLYKFQGNIEITPNDRFDEAYAAGDDEDSDSDDENSSKLLELPGHNTAEMKPLKSKKKHDGSAFPYYGQKLPLDEKNLMLRGARLRNTKYCYAGIVYAGLETKMQLNANSPPSKFSMTDTLLNRVVIIVFCFKILACIGCAIASTLFESQFAPRGSRNYLPTNDSPVWRGFLSFWSYFAVFSYFIPISCIVTLEVAKLVQAIFMMWDASMVSDEDGTLKGMTVKNSNLNDELARVSYIFCDKTGTLTENRMVFDKASIGGVAYTKARNRQLYKLMKKSNKASFGNLSNRSLGSSTMDAPEDDETTDETPMETSEEQVLKVLDFVLLLAVANTSQVEYYNPEEEAALKFGKKKKKKSKKKKSKKAKKNQGDGPVDITVVHEEDEEEDEEAKAAKRTTIRYQAQSPDEICLCNFARDNGVVLKERRNTELVVDVFGEEQVYEILQVMEFTSDRRRMSVILRQPDGKIVVYSKGADSIMMARLSDDVPAGIKKKTQAHIDEFSLEGLRTLICGKKMLTDAEYNTFAQKYNAALAVIDGRDEKVEELSDAIERDFELVGCTAIEDKLQDGVPEAIAYFIAGGIKVWIITGDKQATAINIAKSCNLIQGGVETVIVNAESDEECNAALDAALQVVNTKPRVALVIDGPSLPFAFSCGSKLLAVSMKCEAVVVCRATPLQKALVVRMIKRGTNALTLAVGDGANDVSMLQEAHIGVGIHGKEGSQAARSGDYAIYAYRHLKRLVCIQGRYNLLRSSALIQFSYYKNLAMFLVQLWFSFFNGFSGNPIYESFIMAVFNVIITAAPPLLIGIFERDVRERMLEKFPQAHRQIQAGEGGFTYRNFMLWIISAIYHSLVIFFVPFFCFWYSTTSHTGRDTDFFELGMTTFIGGFFTVILKIAMITQWWIWIVHVGIWGSVVVFFALFWVLSSMPAYFPDLYYVFYYVWSNPVSVFCFIVVPIIALLPDFLGSYIRRNYFPRDHHILQELDVMLTHGERQGKLSTMHATQEDLLNQMHVKPPDYDMINRTTYIDDLPEDRRNAEIAAQQHEEAVMAAQLAESEEMERYERGEIGHHMDDQLVERDAKGQAWNIGSPRPAVPADPTYEHQKRRKGGDNNV